MINSSQIARIAIIALLILGCSLVLLPFMAAILFAAILCVFTWPLYCYGRQRLGSNDVLAAAIMTVLLLIILLMPVAYLSVSVADYANTLYDELQYTLQNLQPHAPVWMQNLPFIGGQVSEIWERAAVGHDEL